MVLILVQPHGVLVVGGHFSDLVLPVLNTLHGPTAAAVSLQQFECATCLLNSARCLTHVCHVVAKSTVLMLQQLARLWQSTLLKKIWHSSRIHCSRYFQNTSADV
jgi:hypothetical protein